MIGADVTHYPHHSVSIGGARAGAQNTWLDISCNFGGLLARAFRVVLVAADPGDPVEDAVR
jgi:hypothetical protein